MTEGIVYYVTGESHLENAETSVKSLKKVMPDIPVTLYANDEPDSEHFDNFVKIDVTKESRHEAFLSRISYFKNTPYDRTLYLDADTYIDSNIEDMFGLLDEFDIAAAHAPVRNPTVEGYESPAPESFPQFNCGVILFENSPAVMDMFSQWEKLYSQNIERANDQPFFRDALYQSDLRVATLPPEYNCRFAWPGYAQEKIKIFHGTSANFESLSAVLNKRENGKRVYTGKSHRQVYSAPKFRTGPVVNQKYPGAGRVKRLLNRFGEIVRDEGLESAIRKSIQRLKKYRV